MSQQLLFGSVGLGKSYHESVWLTAGAVSCVKLNVCLTSHTLLPRASGVRHKGLFMSNIRDAFWIMSSVYQLKDLELFLRPWISQCHFCRVRRSTGFSGLSFRPGGWECAGGSSSSRVQHRCPLLCPGVDLLISQRAGQAQIGQGIQGAIWVHHHVNYCLAHNKDLKRVAPNNTKYNNVF